MKTTEMRFLKKTRLPNNCSICETDRSEKWTPVLLCCRENPKHLLMCVDCYRYYGNSEPDYRFWIERNTEIHKPCDCGSQ